MRQSNRQDDLSIAMILADLGSGMVDEPSTKRAYERKIRGRTYGGGSKAYGTTPIDVAHRRARPKLTRERLRVVRREGGGE